MQSAQARHTETEEERSIKALFTERIVKGRPDLFSPTAESPSHASPVPEGRLSDHLRDFNKRFGRSDAKYLRDAVTTFCDETRRMYQSQYPSDYTPTPPASPLLPPMSGASPAEVPRQRLEDRLHSFTDALMAEIKKHKAWRGADEATLRSRNRGVLFPRYPRLRGETAGGTAARADAGCGAEGDGEGGPRTGGENGVFAVPDAGKPGRGDDLQRTHGDHGRGHAPTAGNDGGRGPGREGGGRWGR